MWKYGCMEVWRYGGVDVSITHSRTPSAFSLQPSAFSLQPVSPHFHTSTLPYWSLFGSSGYKRYNDIGCALFGAPSPGK